MTTVDDIRAKLGNTPAAALHHINTGECPYCGSADLYWDVVELQEESAYQAVTCHQCDRAWDNIYRFVGMITQDSDPVYVPGYREPKCYR